jgi:adenylate cyclase
VDVEAWVEAGLYDPEAPEAEERLALLDYLTERGASISQMVEAHQLGGLPSVAGDLVFGPGSVTLSVQEMSARSGVPEDRVRRVLLSVGVPLGADTEVPEGFLDLLAAFEQAVSLMGEDAILAFSRVLGAAATNIAEAAVALFFSELGPGTEGEGATELARAQVAELATMAFANVPDVLSNVLRIQFDRVTRRAAQARGWTAPTDGGNGLDPEHGEVVALGFVDLVGSTAWAETLNLRDQSLALARFESASWSIALLSGGRVIKMIGDEVFFAAPSVDAACRIAGAICRVATDDEILPPARGAVGYGLVVPRDGDYFGPLVNLISRLVKVAKPNGVVVTEAAAARLEPDRWTLRECDTQPLRGIEHVVRVLEVSPSDPR